MPTIKKPNQHFDATLWTGTGSTQSITNAGGFQPDFVWSKRRNGIASNILIDSIVGGNPPERYLSSDTTSATTANADVITALNNNGFTVGTSGALNGSTNTYVGWQWKAGGSTTVNTSGSISSNVSVNATAGFSVVTFTGTGASGSIGHGLGVAPKFMIFKRRDATNDWNVLTNATGSNQYGFLNLTTAFAAAGETWTSTVVNIGANFVNGGTYVSYCFAEVEGYSKFGSYTGNGSTNGPFQYTGFRPKFIVVKKTSDVGEWAQYDSVRETFNPNGAGEGRLRLNTTAAAAGADSAQYIDFLSNGFKIRNTSGFNNDSGGTYIYMAFAEAPFKFSNAR